jgi:hypothetical protein
MKIFSIDVGIKNLSFCLFEIDSANQLTIIKWDNIDLSEKNDFKCIEIDKNGLCNKPAKFTKDDKCPKEGRDIFQFILSFWSNKHFREKCSVPLQNFIESIILPKYSTISKKLNSFDWSYLVTRNVDFSYPQLEPSIFLQTILEKYPHIAVHENIII